jgi:hypothetical protein
MRLRQLFGPPGLGVWEKVDIYEGSLDMARFAEAKKEEALVECGTRRARVLGDARGPQIVWLGRIRAS